jgi:hypothetical protein
MMPTDQTKYPPEEAERTFLGKPKVTAATRLYFPRAGHAYQGSGMN